MTAAAMFPDRMDKLVLDGVLNPYEYCAGTDVEEITDTDAVFAGFFSGCLADPSHCALSKDGKTADELSQKAYSLLYQLKYHPLVTGPNISSGYIDYGILKGATKQALYKPTFWLVLSIMLHELLQGNATAALLASGKAIFPSNGPGAFYGIRCSDSPLRSKDLDSLESLLDAFYAKSKLFGDILPVQVVTCAQWPFVAKERYSGSWEVNTKNPVLFIGNTYDPFTPLISARNASAGFKNSVVLQHDGYGVSHCSRCQSFWKCYLTFLVARVLLSLPCVRRRL
jgi:pimeloyl-ACP methyl ester carboxylesterase